MATYKKWTDVELDFIRNNLKVLADGELASKLSSMTGENISQAMVRRQRRKLGIKKAKGRPPKNKVVENNEGSDIVNI
ncbi:hypothetical protein EBS40_02120 [bacterium]|nr:hypothetical protein [bacterium]